MSYRHGHNVELTNVKRDESSVINSSISHNHNLCVPTTGSADSQRTPKTLRKHKRYQTMIVHDRVESYLSDDSYTLSTDPSVSPSATSSRNSNATV